MSPGLLWRVPLVSTKLGSLVGKSNSDEIAGSDWPLSERKKPSKFPSSLLKRYEAIALQLPVKRLFNVTSKALYVCWTSSNDAGDRPQQFATGLSPSTLVMKYSTLTSSDPGAR